MASDNGKGNRTLDSDLGRRTGPLGFYQEHDCVSVHRLLSPDRPDSFAGFCLHVDLGLADPE